MNFCGEFNHRNALGNITRYYCFSGEENKTLNFIKETINLLPMQIIEYKISNDIDSSLNISDNTINCSTQVQPTLCHTEHIEAPINLEKISCDQECVCNPCNDQNNIFDYLIKLNTTEADNLFQELVMKGSEIDTNIIEELYTISTNNTQGSFLVKEKPYLTQNQIDQEGSGDNNQLTDAQIASIIISSFIILTTIVTICISCFICFYLVARRQTNYHTYNLN